MPHMLRQLAKLSPSEWSLLARLSSLSLFVSYQLYGKPLPFVVQRLVYRAQIAHWLWKGQRSCPYDLDQLARVTGIAARFCLGTGYCLARSLLLFWLLRRNGQVVNLCVGIRKEHAVLHGHAWVEINEKVVAEDPAFLDQFATVLRF
jgi:transglutaminase superfamily protein